MNAFQNLLRSLLPILVTLGLGMVVRKTGLLNQGGAETLKKVVSRITLPFVIFQAFLTADYGTDMAVVFLLVLALCLITFAAGFVLRKRMPGSSPLLPFTVAGYEMGMLGYPLFLILAGAGAYAAQILITIGLRDIPTTEGSVHTFVKIPLTVIAGYLFLDDPITLRFVAGTVLLLVGLFLNDRRPAL